MAQLTSENNETVKRLSDESTSKLLDTERSHHEKIEALRRENKQAAEQNQADLESLRQQKDSKIRQIEREREEQRNIYELKINDLDNKIKSKSFEVLC